jgi:ribosome maturation protein Sdo1
MLYNVSIVNLAFQIFESQSRSAQGIIVKPSKARLLEAFGTDDETKIATTILTEGRVEAVKESVGAKGYTHPM